MVSAAEKLPISAKDYLQGEASADCKHEYLNGEVWAMVGATDAHVTIAGNLFALLKQSLKGTSCRAYISDMKVNVEKANAFFYPDVLVTCDARDRDNSLFKQHPVFIAEVLSPSTEAFDRGQKFSAYRRLDSLQTYWLIDSRKMSVDCFNRTDNNEWLLHGYEKAEEILRIPALDLEWPLQSLYEEVL
ncbi:MAG: Uma2 family endonuclease [Methylomicrobium sp.]